MKKYFFGLLLFVLIFVTGNCSASSKKNRVYIKKFLVFEDKKVTFLHEKVKKNTDYEGQIDTRKNEPQKNQFMYHVPCNPEGFNYDNYLKILTDLHKQQREEKEKSEWKDTWWTPDEDGERILTDEEKNF